MNGSFACENGVRFVLSRHGAGSANDCEDGCAPSVASWIYRGRARRAGFADAGPLDGVARHYDAFALVIPGLIWVTVTLTPLEQIRAVAQRQDVGRTVIFIFVI